MSLKIKKTIVALALAAAVLCLWGCAPDDIDISGYADETIAIEGLSDESVSVSIAELKDMECISVKTESTSDKIGKVKATGPTLQTVLAAEGADLAEVKKITFHGIDDYSYSLNADYIAKHDIILAFGVDGKPLDEESVPCRVIIPKSDSAYWIRMLDRIELDMK